MTIDWLVSWYNNVKVLLQSNQKGIMHGAQLFSVHRVTQLKCHNKMCIVKAYLCR